MTEKDKVIELYEFNANGSWITPQMARAVREKAPKAAECRVHPMQMKKIINLNSVAVSGADVSLTAEGHVFAGLHLTQDALMPDNEMRFYAAKGVLVAKIVGLER